MAEQFLPCKNPECGKVSRTVTLSAARAISEYHVRRNPGYIYGLQCNYCADVSSYTHDEILRLIPRDMRMGPLPADNFWAYLLFELDVWKRQAWRVYLGDRILVRRLHTDATGSWYGEVLKTSPYVPVLKTGDYVSGRPRRNFELCLFMIEGNAQKAVPRPMPIPRGSSFGMFLSPRQNDEELLCANVMCANPSCSQIFSTMTHARFLELVAKKHQQQEEIDLDVEAFDVEQFGIDVMPTVMLECPLCGTTRVVDEQSFDGLFKG